MGRLGQRVQDTSPKRTVAALRREQVLNLRLAGLTWGRIAEAIGVVSDRSVRRIYDQAMEERKASQETVDELRTMELMRAEGHHQRITRILAGPDVDPKMVLDAIRADLAVSERVAKLFGLDAAVKFAGDPDGEPVRVELLHGLLERADHLRDVVAGRLPDAVEARVLDPGEL